MPYRTRDDLCSRSIETCWIEIIRPRTKSMFVCSAYRPPEFPLRYFIEELNKDLGKIPENAEIVLLGGLKHSRALTRSNKSLRHQRDYENYAVALLYHMRVLGCTY